jgi:hypothetical protein
VQYTVVITSSGRPQLLKQTIDAFTNTRDVSPREIIVIDDGAMERPDWFPRHNVTWINNGTPKGQIYSVDRAYERVTTPYIFHLEDDWGFHNTGYVERSLQILEQHPDVFQVWLRGIPTPADIRDRFTIYRCEPHPDRPYHTAKYHWDGWRGGFSFNPGLRRLSDWKRIGSYGRHVGYDPKGCGERALGCLYDDLGYHAAILPEPIIYHLGDESHVDRKLNPDLPKILIAIPTADTLDYRKFQGLQKAKYGRNWPGGISGLQIDGPNRRKQAVEQTWWKDVAKFPNVTAKFFTGAELGCSDDFVDLPEKNRRLIQYAIDNGFDKLFRCDDDTFVFVDRLVRQAIENPDIDFAGADCGGIALGGAGIWLSRRAMGVVVKSQCPEGEWRDDAWISDSLKANGIKMVELPGLSDEMPGYGRVTLPPRSPEQMYQLHKEASCTPNSI